MVSIVTLLMAVDLVHPFDAYRDSGPDAYGTIP